MGAAIWTHREKAEREGEAKLPNQDGGEEVSDYMNTRERDDEMLEGGG